VETTTIIWATDGSDLADRALEVVLDFARNWTQLPRIVAVHIDQRWSGREMNVPKLAGEEDLVTKIQSQIQTLENEGFATGFELRHAHRMEDQSNLIASVAAEINAQLIVVGSRGQGRLVGALLGSVAQGLLHSAACPVLVIPPGDGKQPATDSTEGSTEAKASG